MQSHSGSVIRKYLKRGNFPNAKKYWRLFRLACDTIYGAHQWAVKDDGVYAYGSLVVPASEYGALLGILPKQHPEIESTLPNVVADVNKADLPVAKEPAPVERFESADDTKDADEPTFKCPEEGCSYVGYTKKALEAHKRRVGH